MRSSVFVLLVVGFLIGGQTVEAADASPEAPTARLDGAAIPLSEVPKFHCHDGRYPVIHCFTTEISRDRDAAAATQAEAGRAGVSSEVDLESSHLVYYVTFYQHAGYGGASYTTWQPLADLSTMFWNDIISSFKSLNGQRPKWYVHANYGTPSYQWTAGQQVENVGESANDRFSSVKNVP